MPFVSPEPFQLEPLDDRCWRLVNDVIYQGARTEEPPVEVKRGKVTDLTSSPRPFTPFVPRYGVYSPAAVVHDECCERADGTIPTCPEGCGYYFDHTLHHLPYCYDMPRSISRRDADGLFRRILREQGVPFPRRWLMWGAVRVGGRMSGATFGDWWRVLLVLVCAVPYALSVLPLLPMLAVDWAVNALARRLAA